MKFAACVGSACVWTPTHMHVECVGADRGAQSMFGGWCAEACGAAVPAYS